jgi:hypothetical protein
METNLTQEYLDRITRSVGGTVAKPAQPNVRSDAASQNEAATAVAGAGPGVPEWKLMCVVVEGEMGPACKNWCAVLSPTRKYWWSTVNNEWIERDKEGMSGSYYLGVARASEALATCHTCPPDWPTPAHVDDPREEPERFDEATGPMPQAFTTIKPKPVDSIEKLIDRLAKVNGAITVNHGMQYRVTGQVEKAEPRTHDEPGYPEHFALHHVYLPEEWTRDILASMSSDLTSKLDKGTLRTVLESAARALLLTGSLDEADLLGLAVAVEDKLDIGK